MIRNNRVISYSGAADKIPYHYGHYYNDTIRNGNLYDAYHGISSGAIIVFNHICGIQEKAKELALTFSPKTCIFGFDPMGLKGKYKAIKSTIKGENGFWQFNLLEDTLRGVTSKTLFDSYVKYYENGEVAPVYVGITGNKKAEYKDINLCELSYDDAIATVIDSSRIQGVIKTGLYGDGGLRNHIGSEFLAEKYPNCDVVSVFARTQEFTKSAPKSGLKYRLWVLEVMLNNISLNNETETDKICEKNGTNHIKYFMNDAVIEGFFQIKPHQNKELFEMGLNAQPIIC